MLYRIIQSFSAAGLLTASAAHAGAFSYGAQSRLSSDYDDNINLAVVDQVASWNRTLAFDATVEQRLANWSWSVSPRMQAVRYQDISLYDRNEGYLAMSLARTTELTKSTLVLDGVYDTTLTSELGLTGLTQVNKRHRNLTSTVDQSWQVSPLTQAGVQAAWIASRYVKATGSGLVDYNYATATVSGQHALSELTTLLISLNGGQLQVLHVPALDKRTYSSSLGIQRSFDANTSLTLSVGPSWVRSTGVTSRGYVYTARFSRQRALANLSAGLTRTVTPTGYGALSRQDEANLSWYQPLTPRWFATLSLSALHNRYVQFASDANRYAVNYGVITGSSGWHVTPSVDLRLSAGYATQRITDQQGAAARRHLSLTLVWNGSINPFQ